MAVQKLFGKPKGVSYTQMCIDIDREFYEDNPDYNKLFNYMWCLGYMLAAKRRYFNNTTDYEEFAAYMAYDTYKRMIDPTRSRVKSVLNYMKSVLFFRKCAFSSMKSREIIDPEFNKNWDPVTYTESYKESLEKSNRERITSYVIETFKNTPTMIKKYIPRVYRSDKKICENIYISCLLSLISKFTLSNSSKELLDSKLEVASTFNDVKFYRKHLDDDIIMWHLPSEFEPVVLVIINKIQRYIIDDISEILDTIKVSDHEFESIISSGLVESGGGGASEANY